MKGIIDKIFVNIILDFENDRQIRTKIIFQNDDEKGMEGSNTLSSRGMLASYRACAF